MKLHQKPTKEELEAGIKKSQEELDKLEAEANPDDPNDLPQPSASEEIPTPSASQEIPEDNEDDPGDVSPSASEEIPDGNEPEAPPKKEEKPEDKTGKEGIDYKKRYSDSTREAMVQAAKAKKMEEAIELAGQLPEPTEEELKSEYPDWDDLDSTTQKLAKDNLHQKRKVEAITKVSQEGKDIDSWNKKVDEFVEDPIVLKNNPRLEGKQEEFKVFAMKPTRRGVDFETLISSFLYTVDQERPKNKGSMFPTGNGGPNNRPKPRDGKLTFEQGQQLQKTNYKKYKEYLSAGKIADPII